MNEAFTLDRDFLFKSKIYEITSISIEQDSKIEDSCLTGEFTISGSYRLHEISINKEDFSFKIPFKNELKSNINMDTVKLEISDFNYNFNNYDELNVHVEYIITAEEGIKVFESEEKLDDFLNEQKKEDIDIIDLRSDREEEKNEIKMPVVTENNSLKEEDKIDENMIINSINDDDEYVLYHVHTVGISDSIESITKKYNISVNTLKEYNTFDNLELNMKLIIPNEEL